MTYWVIYDGNCNLCATLVQLLEQLDGGRQFQYIPMQAQEVLSRYGISPEGCELGMILMDAEAPDRRWQGSSAAEEIARLLPGGEVFISAYRALPGIKPAGDRVYEHIRDRRYALFGKRERTYRSQYPAVDAAIDPASS